MAATLTSVILIAPAAGTQEKPAGATAKLSSTSFCPDGSFCVYAGKNYTGKRLKLNSPPGVLSTKLFKEMNNKVSSAKNRWKHTSYLYEDKNGGGQASCFSSGEKKPDLSILFDEFNNDASSSRRSTTPFCGP
ncbi:MAG: peptidase inhibitor family I36 protein [Actinomycetota bacterium]|nr:peptidase inhibitor family I36 protein [Actinomycetota bacterium]